jgi:ribosomal protein S18 acetylase RimI-like enzyme
LENIVIRQANKQDAEKLFELNEEFNEEGKSTIDHIINSLESNKHEIVCVVELNNEIIGFCCMQIVKSLCYILNHVELTELFIKEAFRRKGLATKLIKYMENICINTYGINKIQLLTGGDNISSRKLYESLGYEIEEEVFYIKNI